MIELKSINTEIQRLDNQKKELKKKAALVNNRIVEYLQQHKQKGVKTKDGQGVDTAFILHTSHKTITKAASDKTKDAIEILRSNGVPEPEKVLKQLEDGRKGSKVPVQTLKILQNK
jgi:hypothetical protein